MLVRIRDGVAVGDLDFQGQCEAIAVHLVDTDDGLVVIDPGPASCADAFHEALRLFGAAPGDIRHLLLTHIHLDHAGHAGALAQAHPRLRVHVHERGAPHLADPTRLLASATRLYGDAMDRLWGPVMPVPRDRIQLLTGGERLTFGRTHLRVAATPGHAIHHVAFLDEHEGLAWVGDVAGERSQHDTPPLPAAPPPDIDLPAWDHSIDLIAGWDPELLLLTHFGPVRDARAHLAELRERLHAWAEAVRRTLDTPGTDEERTAAFADDEWARLTAGMPADRAAMIDRNSITASWAGLARYWRTRPPADA